MLITLLPADEHIRNQSKIANLIDFNEVFELVKFIVSKKFDLHRAGLGLILEVMPSNLGACHILGSNIIVLNKFVLELLNSFQNLLRTIIHTFTWYWLMNIYIASV